MADFVFTSPGVKFREKTLQFITKSVGLTRTGLVGETMKGPAFEHVFVQDKTEFLQRFGYQSPQKYPNGKLRYELPYAANAYLEESDELWITRVLGLSGYDAGTAWAITISAGADPSTSGQSGTTTSQTDVPFSGGSFLGQTIYENGQTGTTFAGWTKINGTESFTGAITGFTVTAYDGLAYSGTTDISISALTATSYTDYENMVVAVIRSRAHVIDKIDLPSETVFDAENVVISANTTITKTGDLFGTFKLRASKPSDADDIPKEYVVSLNPNSSDFISNVIGSAPKDKGTKVWVEAIYPDLIKKMDADGLAYGVNTVMINGAKSAFIDYKTQFRTPETPWVVSQLKGNIVDRLFKFISISDGDAANREIKITISNIKPETGEFDIYVRDFYDTDATPSILEAFTRCSLVEGKTNFIGQRIGTIDGKYDLQSKYIIVELADNIPESVFPAGFEGYILRNYATYNTGDSVAGLPPKIFYKLKYEAEERVSRIYLGVSPAGYNGNGLIGTGINQNLFNFNNWRNNDTNISSGFTKSHGFHMDSGATGTYGESGVFEVGAGKFSTIDDITNPANPYYELNTRKFTFVPAGGFDGWNVHRDGRTTGDLYRLNGPYDGVEPNTIAYNDFQAWEMAIDTFSNPEEVSINLFAAPGLNWSDNNILVKDTIEMMEQVRTDSLYIVDSPNVDIKQIIGEKNVDIVAAEDVVDALNTADIDSSYAATFFPYIQIRDVQNNINVFIPPTGEVLKAIAYTDKVKFPWFAPAGITRGTTDAKRSKYRLSEKARGILYQGRINPLAEFADVGTAIFGQKTLLDADNPLNRINVRRLLLQVKVLIANISNRLLFDQNDQEIIDQFLEKVNPIFDTIKRERGLYKFEIKMNNGGSNNTPETRDRHELYGEIHLYPTPDLEYIGITFSISPEGAAFLER